MTLPHDIRTFGHRKGVSLRDLKVLKMKLTTYLIGSAVASNCTSSCLFDCEINKQIDRELGKFFTQELVINSVSEASNFYLALSYKFASQDLNRPNFSKLLSNRATEERDHANGLANFQLLRGADVEIYRKLSQNSAKSNFQFEKSLKVSPGQTLPL